MTDYPTYSAQRVTIDAIVSSRTYTGMHPTMQDRVRQLIEASGGKVGLGQGLRDPKQQLQMFLSRHVPDPNGTVSWDGRRWSRLPGVAAAAPPGMSMHEIGLAADMTGDMGWLRQNVASFGLQTFEKVNSEPWHVQPVELPRGRSSYQRAPAWGLPPWDPARSPRAGIKAAAPVAVPAAVMTSSTPLTPALRLRPGDSGPAAAVLAEALIARSLVPDGPGSRDGVYGADDEAVVREFQRANGLTVDGVVGPQTWGPLLRVVNPGDTGPHVVVLQVTLIVRGLLRDSAGNRDGVYGDATQRIVRQFQALAGLGADGQAGPQTWTALIGEKKRISVATRGGAEVAGADDGVDLDDIDMLAVYDGLPVE
jgi:peptidoglycan hydrolase-like protein with peptidoglycan-binding domain